MTNVIESSGALIDLGLQVVALSTTTQNAVADRRANDASVRLSLRRSDVRQHC